MIFTTIIYGTSTLFFPTISMSLYRGIVLISGIRVAFFFPQAVLDLVADLYRIYSIVFLYIWTHIGFGYIFGIYLFCFINRKGCVVDKVMLKINLVC